MKIILVFAYGFCNILNAMERPATEYDVRLSYNLVLGREPESEDAVKSALPTTIHKLHERFIHSLEHKGNEANRVALPSCFNPKPVLKKQSIQFLVSDEEQQVIFERVRSQWEKLGQEEPYWSVLTNDQYRMQQIDIDAFYRTSSSDLDILNSALHRIGIDTVLLPLTLLELGCGVGRATYSLSTKFQNVTALDISRGNLDLARSNLARFGVKNVSFNLITEISDFSRYRNFDFFYSCIVLQHNTPPVQYFLLDTILSNLNNGGFVLFQIPTYIPDYSFSFESYLSTTPPVLEMHCLPQYVIFELFKKHKIDIIDVNQDAWCGPTIVSHTFFGRKQ